MVTLVTTSIQLGIEYQRDIEKIDDQFVKIEKSFTRQIAEALWFFNLNALKLNLYGIRHFQDIEYLELNGEGGVSMVVGQKRSEYTIEKKIEITHMGENNSRHIGDLKVVASLSNVYRRLFDRVVLILISQTIKTFVVSIFIYYLFYFSVVKHLSEIDGYLKGYSSGNKQGFLRLSRKNKSSMDELDQVVASINEASVKLKRSHETLERKVDERTKSLQDALCKIKTLSGLLPICSYCKKVRDDKGYWKQIDAYIHENTEADISHGICPDCAEKYYPDMDLYGDED